MLLLSYEFAILGETTMKTKTLIKTLGVVAVTFAITLTTATSLANNEEPKLTVNAAEIEEAAEVVKEEIEVKQEEQVIEDTIETEEGVKVVTEIQNPQNTQSTQGTQSKPAQKTTTTTSAKKYTTQATTYDAIMARIPEVVKREFGGVVIPKVWDTVDWAYGYVIYGQNKIYLRNNATKNNDYVVTHEMAHVFAGRTGADLTSKWVEIFNKEWKSGYGATSQKEAFADSLAALLVPRKANLLNGRPLSSQYVQELIGWLPRTSLTSEVNINRTFAERNGKPASTQSTQNAQNTQTSKPSTSTNTTSNTTTAKPAATTPTQAELRAKQYKALPTYSTDKVLNVYGMDGVSIGRQSGVFKVERTPSSLPLGGFNWVKVYLSEENFIKGIAHKIELNHDGSTGLRDAYRNEQIKLKQQAAYEKQKAEAEKRIEEQNREREAILAKQEAERKAQAEAQQNADIETNN